MYCKSSCVTRKEKFLEKVRVSENYFFKRKSKEQIQQNEKNINMD